MENATIVAMWAAALGALFGPIISVAMAHMMMKHENKRRDSATLFRQVAEDVNSYRVAFLQRHYAQSVSNDAIPGNPAIGPGGKWLGSLESKADYERRETYFHKMIQYSRDSGERMRAVQAMLRADQISLRLFFDRASEKCVKAIGELYALESMFTQHPRPTYEDCEKRLSEKIEVINNEISALFETTKQPEELR